MTTGIYNKCCVVLYSLLIHFATVAIDFKYQVYLICIFKENGKELSIWNSVQIWWNMHLKSIAGVLVSHKRYHLAFHLL